MIFMKQKLLQLSFVFVALSINAQDKNGFIFAEMETENAQFLQQQNPDSIQIISSKNDLSAIYFHPSISEQISHKFAHGSGYIYRSSKEKALQFLDKEILSKKVAFNYTITESAYVNQLLNDVDPKEIEKTILLLEGFKTRYHTRAEANQAIYKIKEIWENMIAEAGRNDVKVKVIDHTATPMKSLILTFEGREKQDEYIIIGGHADSTIGWVGDQSFAPGADDNASGIATITEVLRVLLKNDFYPVRTTEIMAYAAEEVGLVGSADIAESYASQNKKVIGYVQFDMTNYKGSAKDIVLMTDNYCDVNLNNFLKQLMDHYNKTGLHQFTYDTSKCGYGCSDHASWAKNGFAATLPFEAKMNEDNPYIHSVNDTYASMGNTSIHAAKFSKLGLEYVVEAAKRSTLSTNELTDNTSKFYVINKTFHYRLTESSAVSIQFVDATGRTIKTIQVNQSEGNVDLSNFAVGYYVAVVLDNKGKSTSTKLLVK